MKLKLKYIYALLFIAIAVIFLLVSTDKNQQENSPSNNIMNKQMPEDDVHKELNDPNSPNRSNVSASVFQKLDELKKQAEQNPNDISKLRELADFLTAAHKPDEAILYYERLLKIQPEDRDALFNLSYIYSNKRDFSKAEIYTNQILKLYPKDSEALYNLGAINASRGDKQKAREIWERIVKNFPNSQAANLAKTGLAKL